MEIQVDEHPFLDWIATIQVFVTKPFLGMRPSLPLSTSIRGRAQRGRTWLRHKELSIKQGHKVLKVTH